MKIPNFIDVRFTDENGYLTDIWKLILNQLFDQLQKNVSEEGFVIPSLSTDDISNLTKSVDGTIVYDNVTKQLKAKINNVFKIITVT